MHAYTKNDHLIVHELDDEVLLYDPSVDRSHRLNACATFIWRHCDGSQSTSDIAQRLTEAFDVAFEVALQDTEQAICRLVEENILTGACA